MGSVGITCEAVATGMQEMLNGERIDLPPVILAQLGTSPNKKTLLVYGYVDVEPADKKDGWKTEPFKLAEKVKAPALKIMRLCRIVAQFSYRITSFKKQLQISAVLLLFIMIP